MVEAQLGVGVITMGDDEVQPVRTAPQENDDKGLPLLDRGSKRSGRPDAANRSSGATPKYVARAAVD